MIVIVDYGLGNLGSVAKAFRYVGAEVCLSADPAVLRSAAALVLPGDGAFAATMDGIRARGLGGVLIECVQAGTPLLGICIGMQVLFDASEEHGRHAGLGLLPGCVRNLDGLIDDDLPVPHMGWNRLWRVGERQPDGNEAAPHPLFEGLDDGAHVYFVHSYFCDAGSEPIVLARTEYGLSFPAVVGLGAVLGLQFHPEKSQAVGLRMIRNFVAWAGDRGAAPKRAHASGIGRNELKMSTSTSELAP